MILYLYGDLAIYAVSITKTVGGLINQEALASDDMLLYRGILIGFGLCVVPVCCMQVTKTKASWTIQRCHFWAILRLGNT